MKKIIICLCILSLFPLTAFAQVNETALYEQVPEFHVWNESEHIKDGYDWSLPDWVEPDPDSAIRREKTVGGRDASEVLLEAGFKGNLMKQVRLTWQFFEPVEGEFNVRGLRELIDSVSEGGKYRIEFHLYASVWNIEQWNDDGSPLPPQRLRNIKELYESAPRWLANYDIPRVLEKEQFNFQITSLDIYNPIYHEKYLNALDALRDTGVLESDDIQAVYLHLASQSKGEEGLGPDPNTPERDVFIDRLRAWADIMGNDKDKLMLVSTSDVDLDDASDFGMGQRGGFVENYLLLVQNRNLGQSVNPQGYLEVDETVPLIREKRRSGDENEAYAQTGTMLSRFGDFSTNPHRYREATLRLLQMRRTNYWANQTDGFIDAPLMQYAALTLARDVNSTPDAWVYLRQSNLDPRKHPNIDVDADSLNPDGSIPLKNFERWIYQRDDASIKTTPALPRGQGGKQKWRSKNHEFDYIARQTNRAQGSDRIGFAIDDRFLSGNSPSIAVKVTYQDSGSNRWSLRYTNTDGEIVNRTVRNTDSDTLKTKTWIINDAQFDATGMNNDFFLVADSGDITVSIVRIVKVNEFTPPISACNLSLPSEIGILNHVSTCDTVSLSWPASSCAERYIVRRWTDPSEKETLAALDGQTLSFTDSALMSNTAYSYVVRAANANGLANSDVLEVTTPTCDTTNCSIDAPSAVDLSAQAQTCTSVDLSWTRASCADSYIVRRWLDPSAKETLARLDASVTSFIDTSALPGAQNTYVIRAVNENGIVNSEQVVSATPVCAP